MEDTIVKITVPTQPISTPSSLPLDGEDRQPPVSPDLFRQPFTKGVTDEIFASVTEAGTGDDAANSMGSMAFHQSDKGEYFGNHAFNEPHDANFVKVHLRMSLLLGVYYH